VPALGCTRHKALNKINIVLDLLGPVWVRLVQMVKRCK